MHNGIKGVHMYTFCPLSLSWEALGGAEGISYWTGGVWRVAVCVVSVAHVLLPVCEEAEVTSSLTFRFAFFFSTRL